MNSTFFQDKRVLTVDDSPTIRVFLRSLLGTQGAEVEEAATAQATLDLLAAGSGYDLFLLDLLLPDLDGIHLLKRIREQDTEATVVMLTGAGDVKSATVAIQHGADGYLEKQELSFGGDYAEFFYAIQQAFAHRAGIVAQKQLEQVRKDLYSMVTHDLRNPASAILITTDMLLEDETLTEEQVELIEIIQKSGHKFLELINDYLDFARIDAGYLSLDLDESELVGLVRSVVEPIRRQATAKAHTFELELPDQPVMACVDTRRLEQVLDNLLSNAIKYTPRGGRISLSLSQEGKEAVFTVRDTGIGISPDEMESLFGKYYRAPGASTRKIQGTGLGLLITKQIVEAHRGTVVAESDGVPGRGSSFTVRIPLDLEESGPERGGDLSAS